MNISVTHCIGSSDEDAQKYGYDSWIDYWKEKSKKPLPESCPCCHKPLTLDKIIVGAHVMDTNNNNYYIMPCCNNCNIINSRIPNILKTSNRIGKVFFVQNNLLVPVP